MNHFEKMGESSKRMTPIKTGIALVIVTVLLAAAGCSRVASASKAAPPLTVTGNRG